MADPRHRLGEDAEAAVAGWLARAGWRILARRHRAAGGGEVDLIALDPGAWLVAVEVRARRSTRAGSAAGSVDVRRIHRLERTLAAYAATSGVAHRGLRVDLVSVEPEAGSPASPGTRGWRLRRLPGVSSW
jgi:putative endonuclease